MLERQSHVKDSKKAAEASLCEQFKELRRYLDDKEKSILAGMDEAEKSSEDRIEREVSRLQKKSNKMEEILRTINDLDGEGMEVTMVMDGRDVTVRSSFERRRGVIGG